MLIEEESHGLSYGVKSLSVTLPTAGDHVGLSEDPTCSFNRVSWEKNWNTIEIVAGKGSLPQVAHRRTKKMSNGLLRTMRNITSPTVW